MIKLEKILKMPIVLAMLFIPTKLSVDELPKRNFYGNYNIPIERKFEIVQKYIPVKENMSPREKVLATIDGLVGTEVPKGEDICCWTAAEHVYEKAGVEINCIYAMNGGEKLNFRNEVNKYKLESIIIGRKQKGELIFPAVPISRCRLNSKNTNSKKKLDNISPGDILAYVVCKRAGHNAIFMRWKDRENKIAELFDWGAGNKDRKMKYRFYETDLSDNCHPVYIYWEPTERE